MNAIEDRLNNIRQQLEQWEVDALLVASPINRQWLTNFTGSFGYVLITPTQAILATDGRYWIRARAEAPDYTLYEYAPPKNGFAHWITSLGLKRIGIEAEHVTLAQKQEWDGIEGIDWIAVNNGVENARLIKSAEEIKIIRAAARITDMTIAQLPRFAQPGVTEKQVAWELEKFMRENGADDTAFDIIVASGVNSAKPHHTPTDRPLVAGDVIIVDLGAKLNGYHSDLTRTFYLGKQPSDHFWHIHDLVAAAQKNAIKQLRAGLLGIEADALARDFIRSAGYEKAFMHGLGHGVGLEIHEAPRLSYTNTHGILPNQSVVTVEPGIYLENWGGVRIEDLILLHPTHGELLSQAPQEPAIPIGE